MVSINNDKTITVLLATYNGEKYLREQLELVATHRLVRK